MSKLQTEEKKKQYETYVKEVTPVHNLWMNMAKAFLVGGLICTLGQFLLNWCQNMGLILVFLSALTTGLGLYPRLAKWAGAGTLVPITGFANSVAAPAVEFQKEGQVFGIGCKIFTIAGPVILYGILSSWILGILYYLIGRL